MDYSAIGKAGREMRTTEHDNEYVTLTSSGIHAHCSVADCGIFPSPESAWGAYEAEFSKWLRNADSAGVVWRERPELDEGEQDGVKVYRIYSRLCWEPFGLVHRLREAARAP